MQKTDIWAKILSKELKDFIGKLDSGNTNVTEDEAMDILSVVTKEAISKEQACIYLNVQNSQFYNLIKEGKIPKGVKRAGFKELVWYKSDLIKAKLERNKSSN